MIPIQFGDGETAEQTAAALRVCEKKKERSLEPRGRVISDFTAIIQVQLLQQPQQQQQQQGHRTDNVCWKFKANDLDETQCVCACVLVNSTRIIRRREMEGEAKRDIDGEESGLLGEPVFSQLRSR